MLKNEVLNMNTLELWHLINGEYVHIVQVTEGTHRTYYTNEKQEGIVDITGPSYAERKYEKRMVTVKSASGETWEREAVTR
jgi:hypothetical protein